MTICNRRKTYLTPEQIQVRRAGFRNHARFLKRFVDAGGKIVAASDITQTPPGLGMHQEMTAFVEDVGLTPMQAIQSGTKWVAEGFRIPDIGRIEEGKLADIAHRQRAIRCRTSSTSRRIDTVIKDGKVMDRGYRSCVRAAACSSFSADEDDTT